MICPLIEDAELRSSCKLCNAVLCDNSHSKAGYQLMDAVVYLLVDMVWTSGEYDYIAILGTSLLDYLPCL